MTYSTPEDLNTILQDGQDDWFIIIDEYYELLKTSKITHDAADLLPGIFTAGSKHKVLGVSAHNSNAFKQDFLSRRFKSVDTTFCFDDVFPFKKEENLTEVKVTCSDDELELNSKIFSYVESQIKQQKRPCFIFGLGD
jgi:hypothetical protein